MDEILTELTLETLAAAFQGEIIVPSIVQSMMSNEKIERLGITAKRTTADHRLALKVLEARQQAEPAMYLRLTLYWRNECVFSILEVLGCSLKV